MEIGQIVLSISGRDRGSWLLVVKSTGDRVWVADGHRRRIESPKAKNPRHLKPTKKHLKMSEVTGNRRLRELLRDASAVPNIGENR